MSAGAICKRRDATALGRLRSRLGRRANERPAVSCCDELGRAQTFLNDLDSVAENVPSEIEALTILVAAKLEDLLG